MKIEKDIEFKLNILVCGNKKNLLDLIYKENNIIQIDEKIDCLGNKSNYIIKKHEKHLWKFIEFYEEKIDLLIKQIYDIIHTNYFKKNLYGQSIIVYFIENENDDSILKIIEFFNEKMNILHPRIICISNEIKDDYFSKYIKKKELYFDERDIIIIKENMVHNNLIKELYKGYCYYYQIGDDEISIPKISYYENNNLYDIMNDISSDNNSSFEDNIDNKVYSINSNYLINFFITGKPGVGKSSLINVLLNDKRAMEGVGNNVTSKITKYIMDSAPIAFYDTPGFSGEEEVKLTKEVIKKKIQELYEYKDNIHGIFYVLNHNLVRTIDDTEIDFLKFLNNCDVPIFFLLNFSQKKSNKKKEIYFQSLLNEINQNFNKSEDIIFKINLKNDYEGNIIFGLDNLFIKLYEYYSKYKINIQYIDKFDEKVIIDKLQNSIFFLNIKRISDITINCKKKCQNYIVGSSVLGSTIPFITYIPFSDLPIISSIEISLIISILATYGYKATKKKALEILKASGKSAISTISFGSVGYFLGNLIKFIPVSQFIGMAINGSIAATTIYAIGKFTIKYCEDLFTIEKCINVIKIASESYNKGVDKMKILSETFKY